MTEPKGFRRIAIALPRVLAEPFGAALAELRGGAVEEVAGATPGQARLLITSPLDEPPAELDTLLEMLSQGFADELGWPLSVFSFTHEVVNYDQRAALSTSFAPVSLTKHLVLAPSQAELELIGDTRVLRLIPDACFGDGTHVTTRLAAEAVEAACAIHPGASLLDVGTGSGVLGLVGAMSGAGAVLGLDIEPLAVTAARRNAECNGLLARFSSQRLEDVEERFTIVVANLEPRTQLELAQAIAERVAPGGLLLLTGFLGDQAEAIASPYLALGFVRTRLEERDDFALLVLEPHRSPPAAPPHP